MSSLHLGSELLEVVFTPQELNAAMQLSSKDLAVAYLQNTRVDIFRQLANQQFSDPSDDQKEQRIRAYLKGKLDILGDLIDGALNPTPVPVEQGSQGNSSRQSPGGN